MGYRDDFYITDNIIGYTGNAMLHPTVYFKHQCFSGHITQKHRNPENIGRSIVLCANDYYITNYSKTITDQAILDRLTPKIIENGYMFEFYHGRVRHRSRGIFTSIQDLDTTLKSQLFIAIHGFPRIKILNIKSLIGLYKKALDDSNYFTSLVSPVYGYKELKDLKHDIDDSCESVNMDVWSVCHS